MVKSPYEPRTAPKLKIYLKNTFCQENMDKKSYLICCAVYTSLKAMSTNSWYFDSGC